MVLKYAAAAFMPLSILACGGSFPLDHEGTEAGKANLQRYERLAVDLRARILSAEFASVASDLRYLAGDTPLQKFSVREGNTERQSVVNSHFNFCREKGLYDQVRYMDQNGMELLRTDLADGNCHSISREPLQSTADADYFRATFASDKGQIYVSPFDLNIEQEEPRKPTIRFGTPIHGPYGQKRAVCCHGACPWTSGWTNLEPSLTQPSR